MNLPSRPALQLLTLRPKAAAAHGFTMIEMAITLVLVAIMASIALPGMSEFVMRSKLSTQVSGMQADIAYARSEAARRNAVISLCPASVGTGGASTYSCSGSNWNIGWITFVDSSGTVGAFDGTDEVLRVHNSTQGISVKGAGGLASATSLTMRPTGEASVSGSFGFCIPGYPITSLDVKGSGRSSLIYASAITTTCP